MVLRTFATAPPRGWALSARGRVAAAHRAASGNGTTGSAGRPATAPGSDRRNRRRRAAGRSRPAVAGPPARRVRPGGPPSRRAAIRRRRRSRPVFKSPTGGHREATRPCRRPERSFFRLRRLRRRCAAGRSRPAVAGPQPTAERAAGRRVWNGETGSAWRPGRAPGTDRRSRRRRTRPAVSIDLGHAYLAEPGDPTAVHQRQSPANRLPSDSGRRTRVLHFLSRFW